MFFEYSKQGRFVERLERKSIKEERKNFRGKQFSLEELQEFREQSQIFNLLQKAKNNPIYEIFAIWTEYYLSELFSMENKFKQKYDRITKELEENLEQLMDFQKNYGDLALFYHLGFPKYYDTNRIRGLLKRLFKHKINSARLVVLYGSKKPYSDIDIFIVSNEIIGFRNSWLDIYTLTPELFEYSISVFDISVTDPLLTGDLVFGDKNYFEQKKRQLQEQPITQEAIYYNLIKSKEQKIMAKQFSKNSKEYSIGISYAKTYFKNALALRRGKRKLTKKSLIR